MARQGPAPDRVSDRPTRLIFVNTRTEGAGIEGGDTGAVTARDTAMPVTCNGSTCGRFSAAVGPLRPLPAERRIRSQADAVIEDYRDWIARHFGDESLARLDAHVPKAKRKGSRPPKVRRVPGTFYAVLARDYVQAAKGRNPISTLARLRGVSVQEIRSQVHLARTDGFLSETSKGKAGGKLTPKAVATLTKEEETAGH